MKNKSRFLEKMFYNNKFLVVFSLILAIGLWAVVKVNYSDNAIRTISDVKITIDNTLAMQNDFVAFVDEADMYVDVEVTGKSYDISSYSLTRSDITVEAVSGYIDAAGYRVLTLSAKSSDSDISVSAITPSTIAVFYDREAKGTFNVEAKLNNDLTDLESDGYIVGQPVASLSTVEVSGPATVISEIKKVNFEAEIKADDLPLKSTTEIKADVTYVLEKDRGAQFLKCSDVEDSINPATVTVPVSKVQAVPTAVKFINEPTVYENNPPEVTISPATVKIMSNSSDTQETTSFIVGTVDFSNLSNTLNKITLKPEKGTMSILAEEYIDSFDITVDMRSLSKKTIDATEGKIVFLNQTPDYDYDVRIENSKLSKLTLIGPASSLKSITPDKIQIEINVSSLDLGSTSYQTVKVSSFSIPAQSNDCWVYGTYTVKVKVSEKI